MQKINIFLFFLIPAKISNQVDNYFRPVQYLKMILLSVFKSTMSKDLLPLNSSTTTSQKFWFKSVPQEKQSFFLQKMQGKIFNNVHNI